MTESADLARRLGLQLHTHLAETVEEEAYCQELYGCTPVEYLDSLGWLDGDVWCAHCVHLSAAEIGRFAATGTGVAHCPTSNLRLGAGVAPVQAMTEAGVRVGLGVDGSASNERSHLFNDVKQALLVARGRGGPQAMTARQALRLGTRGGAEVLARDDIGVDRGRASAPTSPSGRRTGSSSAAPPTRSPASSSPARTASTGSTSAASWSSRAVRSCGRTRARSLARTARRPIRFAQ